MKIIPVIDILNGIAVHGIRGERQHYKPLESILFNSVNPSEIGKSLKALEFSALYIADLDAIQGRSANYHIYSKIVENTQIDLMVDSGISNMSKANEVLASGVSQIVIGSETLKNINFVQKAIDSFGKNRVIVSIDQKGGKLLSNFHKDSSYDVISFAKNLKQIGVQKVILLDLDRVGTENGIYSALIEKVLNKTGLDVIVGGGIKCIEELEHLRNLGVYGALVATVLYNGKVAIDELKSKSFHI